MALKNSKKVETNRYELEISIDAEAFEAAVEQAFKENADKINIPGFRKGKAPRKMVEKMYGEGVFYEDALNILYPDAVEAAVKEAGLELVGDKIDTDITSIGKDGVEFKVTVTVKPEVNVGEYKGLKVEKVAATVSDEEIDAELNRLADRNARVITAERAAANGDIAVIDFEGFVDGVAFAGGKGEGHDLTLGSGQFIPGFEDQIVGHVAGDEFDVNVTFPTEYHAEELAGKEAVFKTKLNEVKVRELPAIDDDFAKDVSEFDTLDELKKDIADKAMNRKASSADNQVESDLLEQLVASLEGEIPEVMYEQKIDESLRDFDYRLRMQGMSLNDYVKYTGGDITAMRDSFREQAEKQVKMRLALEKVAQLEGIVASDEDVAAEIKRLAEMYNVTEEQVKASVPVSEIAKDLVVGKAVDVIKEAAVITEVKEKGTKKPAAKKSTAKKTAAKKAEDAENAAE